MLLKLLVEMVVDSFVQQLLGKHGFDDDDDDVVGVGCVFFKNKNGFDLLD